MRRCRRSRGRTCSQGWSGDLPRIYRSCREAPAPGERNCRAASRPSVRGHVLDRRVGFPNSALPPFDAPCSAAQILLEWSLEQFPAKLNQFDGAPRLAGDDFSPADRAIIPFAASVSDLDMPPVSASAHGRAAGGRRCRNWPYARRLRRCGNRRIPPWHPCRHTFGRFPRHRGDGGPTR